MRNLLDEKFEKRIIGTKFKYAEAKKLMLYLFRTEVRGSGAACWLMTLGWLMGWHDRDEAGDCDGDVQ